MLVKFFQVILINLFAAQRTLTLCFDPLLDALRVEIVFDVAAQGCNLIIFLEFSKADSAVLLTCELFGVKTTFCETLDHSFTHLISQSFVQNTCT
jgi:hypothetical protein